MPLSPGQEDALGPGTHRSVVLSQIANHRYATRTVERRQLINNAVFDREPDKHQRKERKNAFFVSWTSEDGGNVSVLLPPHVVNRLSRSFTLPQETFDAYLSLYAKHKFEASMQGTHLYTVPSSIYKLFKAVADPSHELFADAINASGVLPYFCSISKDDLHFGSKGSWEDVEERVDGGVGHPPFIEHELIQILDKVREQLKVRRPYFRALILPYEEGTTIYNRIHHGSLAEIVAVIEPKLLDVWLLHQLSHLGCNYNTPKADSPRLFVLRFGSMSDIDKNIILPWMLKNAFEIGSTITSVLQALLLITKRLTTAFPIGAEISTLCPVQ